MAVQELDTAADQARHRVDQHPARRRLGEIVERRRAVGARRADAAGRRDEVAGRQQHLEDELAAAESRRGEVSARLYGGSVSASRDLQAMAAEVEALSARASELEDAALAVLDEREPLDAAVDQLDADDGVLATEEDDARAELAVAERELRAELADLGERRAEAAAALPPDLVVTYDRLRSRLGGVGAARLVGGRCTGCHLALPATELDQIRKLPPGAVVTCDQCGRILVP